MKLMFKQRYNIPSGVFTVQLLCLLAVGIVEFLNMTQGCFLPLPLGLLTNAGIMLSLLGFWAITLWKAPRSLLRRDVILGVVLVAWFLVVEMNRRINHTPLQSVTIFVVAYLLALPFAVVTQDQNRQTGIRLVSGIYIGTALIFLTMGLILLFAEELPGVLVSKVYWDGARLFIIHHPNITSRIFMIALALCMGFSAQTRRIWAKTLLMLVSVLLFVLIVLGNCRAVVLPSCCILAGNVFFLICSKNRRRMLLGAVAAVAVAALLFLSSDWLFEWNGNRLASQPTLQTAQEETSTLADEEHEIIVPEEIPLGEDPKWKPEGNGNSGQGTFLSDLPTLNGRSAIWAAFLQKIQNEPMILLRGVTDSRLVMKNLHTHNAWLEALIILGLPGFLLILFFTWEAGWSSLRLLWNSGVGMFEKNVAMLTLSTMVAAMLEPSLFATYQEWSFSNFFFILSLGYLMLWRRQLPRRK